MHKTWNVKKLDEMSGNVKWIAISAIRKSPFGVCVIREDPSLQFIIRSLTYLILLNYITNKIIMFSKLREQTRNLFIYFMTV